jgi:predicted outer membrane repeat protein
MANVVYGPYAPTTWADNSTPGNHTTLNNLESQAKVALHGFNPDLFTAFVEDGMVCTKDGTFSNQLDVTSGTAYITMTDGTLGQIDTAASTTSEFITSAATSTYHLYLQPDGSWYWSTSNSPQANSLYICSVLTDGSSNISTVTDQRTLSTTFLNNVTAGNGGAVYFNANLHFGGTQYGTGGFVLFGDKLKLANPIIETTQSGGANGITFETWSGSANKVLLSIGGQFNSALSYFDNSGNLNLNGDLISANGGITIESQQSGSANGITFETWSGSANAVPFSVGGQFNSALAYVDSNGNMFTHQYLYSQSGNLNLYPEQAGAANGINLGAWNGSSNVTPFGVGNTGGSLSWVDFSGNYNGQVATGIPTTRNGSATSVPIYTGTSTPSSPPTGAIWIKA